MNILEKIRIENNLLYFFATKTRLPISDAIVDLDYLKDELSKLNYEIHNLKFIGKFQVEMIVKNNSNQFYKLAN